MRQRKQIIEDRHGFHIGGSDFVDGFGSKDGTREIDWNTLRDAWDTSA
jgi:hypothetical protein